MLVCRRWHAIMISIPGISYRLTIRRATQKEVVNAFVQRRKTRLDVRVNMNDKRDGNDFNPENFHACLMAAAQAAPRWSSLDLISPPPHGEYKTLPILQPLEYLESLRLTCGFGEFIEPLMTAISRCDSPKLTTIHLEEPAAVLYLVQPAWLHATHSLATLKVQLSKKMGDPVDILPHLHSLQHFEARNLCLPFYPPNACLPLTRTLHFLHLKSVSVQWMAGHDFPALKRCNVYFPRDADIIQALQPVTMPSCSEFLYHANDLHPLAQFHLPSFQKLDVKSGQWNVWNGNPQLAALCPIVAAGATSLTNLCLDVECSERLLVHMLSLVPRLESLSLGLARPNALSTIFFQAFIIRKPLADGGSDMVAPPGQATTPLCPSLRSLYLNYRKWLRGPDKKALIVALSRIKESRWSLNLELSVDQALQSRWSIDGPVRKSQDFRDSGLILGISAPCGMIPISMESLPDSVIVALPVKGAEYLHLRDGRVIFLDFRFINDHMELMVNDWNHHWAPPRLLPCALPLFQALRVLVVETINLSFLTGHTFHKLERCRAVKSPHQIRSPSPFTETEMPLCTRLDIDDLHVLATIKLPQIHELAFDFSDPDCSTIWEKRIAVNANLSGLTLLHMMEWPFDGDLIPILRAVPSLETLIISSRLGLVSLRAFLPMDANAQPLALLCPSLQSLRIEGQDPSAEPELIPLLKDIVILRAEFGSPLKEFTFDGISTIRRPAYKWDMHRFELDGKRFELVGKNGSFAMKRVVLPNRPKQFRLDI